MRKKADPTTTVLLIDDDEDDYLITKRVFARIRDSSFRLDWCSSFEEAKRLIGEQKHDIYLLDYRLGEHTGLELLDFADPGRRRQPFILLTGTGDRQVEKRAMKLGASDYLIKGSFDSELLSRTLNYALGRKQAESLRLQHLIELNQAKDEFISVASHQLRTPATGVKQYIGMLLEGIIDEPTPSQRTILAKAYESNERQLRIVSDLLKVARVDAGKVMLKKVSTDVSQLVGDVVREQREIAKDRRQSISIETTKVSTMADIDRETVRMVFENLVDNASKYSGEGTTIRVAVEATDDMVFVKVTDQGVGIDSSDQSKLFGKFSRIHNPLSAQVGGSGLGLYWAKKIIDLHNGTITVASKVGNGTTFEVGLPKSL